MAEFPLLAFLDRIYIINLDHRADRRAEMSAQLARVGLSFEHPKVQLVAASRPAEAGEFPNIGTRGCFQSHLGVLQDAFTRDHETILVLEDDADFTSRLCDSPESEAKTIQNMQWGFFYFGAALPAVEGADFFVPIPSDQPLKLSHAIMLRKSAIARAIPYLEAMLERKLGDPKGGPMHLDGAYGWFRREHPDIITYASSQQWMVQRSSKTDIHDTGWKERIPFIHLARRLKNYFSRR